MTQDIKDTKTRKPTPTAPLPPAPEDLSEAISQSVERQADEEVKIVRVFDDRYRCNWWVRDKAAQPMFMTTGKIRRSSFLRATRNADKLVIEDLSKRA